MLHLANPNVSPPGAFRFHIAAFAEKAPHLAWVGPHHSLSDLMADIRKRCTGNGVPIPTEAEVQDQICQRLPPGHCLTQDNHDPATPGRLMTTIGTFAQGTRTLFSWWKNGRRRVSREEAMRRSYICNICPWHSPIGNCSGCAMKPVRALINEIVGIEKYPTDAFLLSCGVCHCSLVAKVRMPKDDILPHMSESQKEQLWEKCWLREENA